MSQGERLTPEQQVDELVLRLGRLARALRSPAHTVQAMPDPPRWEVIRVEDGELIDSIVVDGIPRADHEAEVAKIEQRFENEQVRRLQRDGRCPTCGAES